MTALLALAASCIWGVSDFLGGTAARRLPALWVVGVSQGIALCGLAVVVAVLPPRGDVAGAAGWGVAAGLVGLVALGAFYRALGSGQMGVVAPIAALGVVVPVVAGVARGQAPGLLRGVGIALGVVGVVLASGPHLRAGGARRPLLLAGVAGAGFGLVMLFVADGSRHSTLTTLAVMRATSVGTLGLAALAVRRRPPVGRSDLPILAAIGVGDVAANACYAVAAGSGLLPVVAVLSSLYPAVTVLLARRVHGERLRAVQGAGITVTLAAVALIGAGGGAG